MMFMYIIMIMVVKVVKTVMMMMESEKMYGGDEWEYGTFAK